MAIDQPSELGHRAAGISEAAIVEIDQGETDPQIARVP
jgi:hypothetical protein